jgi:hypothetical protein
MEKQVTLMSWIEQWLCGNLKWAWCFMFRGWIACWQTVIVSRAWMCDWRNRVIVILK